MGAEFGGQAAGSGTLQGLIASGDALLAQADALAAGWFSGGAVPRGLAGIAAVLRLPAPGINHDHGQKWTLSGPNWP
jgi:hypothetical protein